MLKFRLHAFGISSEHRVSTRQCVFSRNFRVWPFSLVSKKGWIAKPPTNHPLANAHARRYPTSTFPLLDTRFESASVLAITCASCRNTSVIVRNAKSSRATNNITPIILYTRINTRLSTLEQLDGSRKPSANREGHRWMRVSWSSSYISAVITELHDSVSAFVHHEASSRMVDKRSLLYRVIKTSAAYLDTKFA